MPVRMDKSWTPLEEASLTTVAAHLGVYQLANDEGEIVYIGVANARTLFGIKGGKEEVNKLYPYNRAEEKGIHIVFSLVFNALAVGMILMLLLLIIGADVIA